MSGRFDGMMHEHALGPAKNRAPLRHPHPDDHLHARLIGSSMSPTRQRHEEPKCRRPCCGDSQAICQRQFEQTLACERRAASIAACVSQGANCANSSPQVVSRLCPVDGGTPPCTFLYSRDRIFHKILFLLNHNGRPCTPLDTQTALSRRKQGFESPRERQAAILA